MGNNEMQSIVKDFTENVTKSLQGENPSQEIQNAVWDMLKKINPDAVNINNKE